MDNLSGSTKGYMGESKSVEVDNTSTDETPIEITQEEFEARLCIIEDLVDEVEARINELYDLRAKAFLYNAKVTTESLNKIINNGL